MEKPLRSLPDEFNWKGKIILIVEDDPPSHIYLKALLGPAKPSISIVSSGNEAIDFCSKNHVDLILMDIQLPGISGYETTKILKKSHPSIPIIAQTAFALSGEKEKSVAAGCDDYITKPINKELLLNMIDKYMT